MSAANLVRRIEKAERFGQRPVRSSALAAAFVACAVVIFSSLLGSVIAPAASADKHKKNTPDDTIALPKKFKGKLPITQLTEDEAINHALNRLAYGPRPGDVERVRQTGLEKWVDQQLNPDSINDGALDERLRKYPTLRMSSKELLEQFPHPLSSRASRSAGLTKTTAARLGSFTPSASTPGTPSRT